MQSPNIFITTNEVWVKTAAGVTFVLPISSREIDLLQEAEISQALADAQPAVGHYKSMEFLISSARMVMAGTSYVLKISRSNKIKLSGAFEIREGYRTVISINLRDKHRGAGLLKVNDMLVATVKISSSLVPLSPADGDIAGSVTDFVTKAVIQGVTATLEGTAWTAVSMADGSFTFSYVSAGDYTLKLSHPDYLDKSLLVTITAGQVTNVVAEMNPAVILSTVGNTGWFSESYPVSEARGRYAEVALDLPFTIDYASLAFVKAEVAFDGEFATTGEATFAAYMSLSKQLQVVKDLGTWWVGNNGYFDQVLGSTFIAAPVPNHYVVDVTTYVQDNPNAQYFLAFRNFAVNNIRLQNIQLKIYYK